jgi:hypothetical protein
MVYRNKYPLFWRYKSVTASLTKATLSYRLGNTHPFMLDARDDMMV